MSEFINIQLEIFLLRFICGSPIAQYPPDGFVDIHGDNFLKFLVDSDIF